MQTGRIRTCFALATLVFFCAPTQANTTNTRHIDVKTTIAEINQILLPYKVKFIAEGLEPGRVVPIDLLSDPTNWRLKEKSQPETLAGKIRILLRAGVCDSNTLALQKIFELDWLLYSLNFTEAEVLFLQRLAKNHRLNLPFHRLYRERKKYAVDVSDSPQLVMRINIAFDNGKRDQALQLVRAFQRLCQS